MFSLSGDLLSGYSQSKAAAKPKWAVVTLHVAFGHVSCIEAKSWTPLGRKGVALLESSPVDLPLAKRKGTAAYEKQQRDSRPRYKLLVYDPDTKRRIVVINITPQFHLVSRRGRRGVNEMLFMDITNRRWAIRFHSDEEADEFCKHLALARHCVVNGGKPTKERELVVQDVCNGTEKDEIGATIGSVVKLRYRIWEVDSKHRATVGKLIKTSEKTKIPIEDVGGTPMSPRSELPLDEGGIPSGLRLGILGLTKHARRILVVPPDLSLNITGGSGANVSVVVFVKVLSVKHKKGDSQKKKSKKKSRRSPLRHTGGGETTTTTNTNTTQNHHPSSAGTPRASPAAPPPLATRGVSASSMGSGVAEAEGEEEEPCSSRKGRAGGAGAEEVEEGEEDDENDDEDDDEEEGGMFGSERASHEEEEGGDVEGVMGLGTSSSTGTGKKSILSRIRRQSRSNSAGFSSIGDIMHAARLRSNSDRGTPRRSSVVGTQGAAVPRKKPIDKGVSSGELGPQGKGETLHQALSSGAKRLGLSVEARAGEGLGSAFEEAVNAEKNLSNLRQAVLSLAQLVRSQASASAADSKCSKRANGNEVMGPKEVEAALRGFYKSVVKDLKDISGGSGSDWKGHPFTGAEVDGVVRRNLRETNQRLKNTAA